MSTWSSGYNTDLGYTFGFYREISPEWLNYVALTKSVTPPSGPWRYLELGCGQGYGLALLAALNPNHDFVGIDFNPIHITHARHLALAAGLKNVRFEEADFLTTAQEWPAAWGKFDYIAAHGIYSWMSLDVCEAIVKTLDRAANSGALFYVSYNTLPAWMSSYPIQHLMRLWQTTESLDSLTAIETGINRLKSLTAAQSGMTKTLPGMKAMLDKVATRDRAYLVQEYLHDNWQPRWFDQVVEELKPAKLTYVGTASLGDLYLTSFLPSKFKEILEDYADPIVREVMLDVFTNQSFRRDVFSRGAAPLWSMQRRESLLQQQFALVNRPKNTEELKFKTSLGELKSQSEIYSKFFDALESGPKTATTLMQIPTPKPLTLGDIFQAITLMLNAGHIAFYCPPADRQPALALNRAIATATANGAPYRFVIASNLGHVMTVSDVDLIFLAEITENPGIEAVELGSALVTRLINLGKGLTKDGHPLTTRETLSPYAEELASRFLKTTLPKWVEVGICA